MTGREFAEKYIELTERKERLDFCINRLIALREDYMTDDAVALLRKEQSDITKSMYKMDIVEIGF